MGESGRMPDEQPVLKGARVTLRPFRLQDVDDVFTACQDLDIQRWTSIPAPYRREDAVSYVEQVAPAAWDAGGGVFAVEDIERGSFAGTIGAQGMTDGIAHIGYWTAASARGRGLTSDALRTITRWFFKERSASRVELVVEPDNASSVRVAQAAGFRLEGVLRSRLVLRGRRADVAMYAVLPDD